MSLDIPAELPGVLADPGLLERVLANLLDNAVRHTSVGEVATVRARAVDAAIEWAVVDRGPEVDARLRNDRPSRQP